MKSNKSQFFFFVNLETKSTKKIVKNPPNDQTTAEKYPKVSIEIFDAEKRSRQIDLTKNFESGQEINIKPADIINENSNKSTKQKGKVLLWFVLIQTQHD